MQLPVKFQPYQPNPYHHPNPYRNQHNNQQYVNRQQEEWASYQRLINRQPIMQNLHQENAQLHQDEYTNISDDGKWFNTYQNAYTNCPQCNMPPFHIHGQDKRVCQNQHVFYPCPECKDTRVFDKKENIIYCGQLHAYHFCPQHPDKVVRGINQGFNCSCNQNHRSGELSIWQNSWSLAFKK